MTTPAPGRTGATRDIGAVRDGRRKRFPLWLLLLLLLLLLAVVAGILIAVFAGGGTKHKGAAAAAAPLVTAPAAAGATTTSVSPPVTPATALTPATAITPTTPTSAPSADVSAAPDITPSAVAAIPAALKGGFVGGGTVRPVPAAGAFAAGDTEGTVLFAENSAALTAYARTVIADAAKVIKADRPPAIVVSGYTDEIAGQPANLTLSATRATAVLTALKADVGPGPTSFSTKDHGENDPIASNSTAAGRQKNRRATITTD